MLKGLRRGEAIVIFGLTAIVVLVTGFLFGLLVGNGEGFERGRELTMRQIQAEIYDGLESRAVFSLAGIDARFIPLRSPRNVLVGRRAVVCWRCHRGGEGA